MKIYSVKSVVAIKLVMLLVNVRTTTYFSMNFTIWPFSSNASFLWSNVWSYYVSLFFFSLLFGKYMPGYHKTDLQTSHLITGFSVSKMCGRHKTGSVVSKHKGDHLFFYEFYYLTSQLKHLIFAKQWLALLCFSIFYFVSL